VNMSVREDKSLRMATANVRGQRSTVGPFSV